jgi:predicted RNA binding protein YcfA (HicA-like mRNA interferase family)
MKLPRDLSGADLITLLTSEYEYTRVHQVGSHVILQTETPEHHRIAIPDHKTLRLGTLNSILRAIAKAKGIDKNEIIRRL